MRKSEDSSYEYHGADAEKTDKANTDDGYPEAVEHNESGSVYDLKTDFIVLLPGEIIRIPQESNLAWMTMFYALPRKLAEGACLFLFFPGFFFQNRWTKRSSQSIIMMRKLTGSQLSAPAAPEGKYADYHNALVSFFRERWQHALVLVRHHPFGDRWAL